MLKLLTCYLGNYCRFQLPGNFHVFYKTTGLEHTTDLEGIELQSPNIILICTSKTQSVFDIQMEKFVSITETGELVK